MKKIYPLPLLAAAAVVLISASAGAQTSGAPDESLTIAEYQQMGVPSPEPIWGAEEYSAALSVFDGKAKSALPRHGSNRSNALFARMVAPENLLHSRRVSEILEMGPEATQAALTRLIKYTEQVPALLMMYIDGTVEVQPYGAEVVRVCVYTLQTGRALFDLTYGFVDSQPEELQNSDGIRDAKKTMRDGLNQTMGGLLQMIQEENAFAAADMEYLANGLLVEVPGIFDYFSPPQKKTVRTSIENISKKHSNRKVRESMKSLLAKLGK